MYAVDERTKAFLHCCSVFWKLEIQGVTNSAANYSFISVEYLLHVQVIKESPEMSEKQVPSGLSQAQGEIV